LSSPSDLPDLEARTMEEVRSSTRFLLKSFKAKIDELRSVGPEVEKLMRFGIDMKSASSVGRSFFGSDEVNYLAVDGTFSVDQHLDLLVFYVGAFGYSGTLRFESDEISVGDPSPMNESSAAVSASIPLSEEDAATVFGQKTESGTEVELERLPNAVMHLAEYYIALKTVIEGDRFKVILLDRTLAGDLAHIVWSTRDLVHDGLSVLEGMDTPFGKVTNLDLEMARMLIANRELAIPSPRSQLLRWAAVSSLLGGDGLTMDEILDRTGAEKNHLASLHRDLLELDHTYHLFVEGLDSERRFKLRPGIGDYWGRVLNASLAVAEHVFNAKADHPLRLETGKEGRWITADDLDYLVLVFLVELTRRAWSERLLPLGLTKDTSASELVKSLMPILESSGLEKFALPLPRFNSDKMLLQANSVVNAPRVPTPWHSLDLDAAFRTMIPSVGDTLPSGEARVRGAYRNVVYPERVFVKSYIQLWSSKSDPAVRSHVFTFDRPAYPGYDHWGDLVLHNLDNEIDERIVPIVNLKESQMTNLAMSILFLMSGEVVPEALGHNYPLFLADKKAKFVLKQSKNAYLGAVEVETAKSELDQQVLFSQKFRDYRRQVEAKRKGA
jgi:hypothetical protein